MAGLHSDWFAAFQANDRLHGFDHFHGSMGRLHLLRDYPFYLRECQDLHHCLWFVQHAFLSKRQRDDLLCTIRGWVCHHRHPNHDPLHHHAEVLRQWDYRWCGQGLNFYHSPSQHKEIALDSSKAIFAVLMKHKKRK